MTPQQWQTIRALVAWLDAENGSGPHEGAMRLLKIGEEVGEYADAVAMGDHEQAAAEAVDVRLTALVALASMTTSPEHAFVDAIPERPASPQAAVVELARAGRPLAQAYIGWQGQNPRKGITHRCGDVADALCRIAGLAEAALALHVDDPAAHFETRLAAVAARVLPNLEAEAA